MAIKKLTPSSLPKANTNQITNSESKSLRQTKFVKEALDTRLNAHRAFAIALTNDAMNALVKTDDEAFSDLLGLAISDFNVKQINIAKALDLTTAAVGRWVSGKSVPRPYARGMVLQVIRSLVEKELIDSGEPLIARQSQTLNKTSRAKASA